MNQKALLNKMVAFLEQQLEQSQSTGTVPEKATLDVPYIQALIKKLKEGHCYGFSFCYAAMASIGRLDWWLAALRAVYAWDGRLETLKQPVALANADIPENPPALEDVFERVLHYVIFSHGVFFWAQENIGFSLGESQSMLRLTAGEQISSQVIEVFETFSALSKTPEAWTQAFERIVSELSSCVSQNEIKAFEKSFNTYKTTINQLVEPKNNREKIVSDLNNLTGTLEEVFKQAPKNIQEYLSNFYESLITHSEQVLSAWSRHKEVCDLLEANPKSRYENATPIKPPTIGVYFELLDLKGNIQRIQDRRSVAGHFTAKDLQKLLDPRDLQVGVHQPNRLCLLSSKNHAVTLHCTDKEWVLYDPDYKAQSIEQRFPLENQAKLAKRIVGILGQDIDINLLSMKEGDLADVQLTRQFKELMKQAEKALGILSKGGIFKVALDAPEELQAVLNQCEDSETHACQLAAALLSRKECRDLPALAHYAPDILRKMLDIISKYPKSASVFAKALAHSKHSRDWMQDIHHYRPPLLQLLEMLAVCQKNRLLNQTLLLPLSDKTTVLDTLIAQQDNLPPTLKKYLEHLSNIHPLSILDCIKPLIEHAKKLRKEPDISAQLKADILAALLIKLKKKTDEFAASDIGLESKIKLIEGVREEIHASLLENKEQLGAHRNFITKLALGIMNALAALLTAGLCPLIKRGVTGTWLFHLPAKSYHLAHQAEKAQDQQLSVPRIRQKG